MAVLAASHTSSASVSVSATEMPADSTLAPTRPWPNQAKAPRPQISSMTIAAAAISTAPTSPFSAGK